MSIDASTVLVTGFEPFEADTLNPAWEVARALDGWQAAGATVYVAKLAFVFDRAMEQLKLAMALRQPQLVICLGLASGRSEVSLERVAINIDDARIADNDGRQPVDLPIVAGGPAAYFSTLPIKAIVRDLRAAGLPGAVSNSAGTFVCNHVFYRLMHTLACQRAPTRGGFVHLPCLPEQAKQHPSVPTMPLA